MRKFDTEIQFIKYKVLCEVAKQTWLGQDSFAVFNDIAGQIVGEKPAFRCCIYKERAIVAERIRIALGGQKDNPNIIEIIDIACDECPVAGYVVTELCRGCLAHRCQEVCKVGAISCDRSMAKIDKSKCVECGKCAKVCPYGAINNFKRPCEKSCKPGAIYMAKSGAAAIDREKCTACGACVYTCPFGATADKSWIADVVNLLKGSKNNTEYHVYAVVAPAIASQFSYARPGQIVAAMKQLGFHSVVEAALGADMVADKEAEELLEKGFLTTSCCPAFVKYIENQYPALKEHISTNLSPMAEIGKYIKEKDPMAKIVFFGPCTAKKAEIQKERVSPHVDFAMTFEELQALIDSKEIEVSDLPEEPLDDASYFGRIFARSGGVTAAVARVIKEKNASGFEFNPVLCDGLDKCKPILLKASKKVLPNNFIEGMACAGGCIGGAGCLTHGEKNAKAVDEFGRLASDKTIAQSINTAQEIIK